MPTTPLLADQPFPPVVYAPTTSGAEDEVRLEMHHTADGRVALFVYSAMDRLAEMYGTDVPWVLLSIPDLQTAFESAPYDLLFLDRAIARDEGGDR